MKFKKTEMTKQEWLFEIGGHEIPIGQIVAPILLVVLMLDLCFQFGVYTQEIIKFTSFMAVDGAYEPGSQLYMKCRPTLERNYVVWDCNLKNGTKVYGDANKQNNLNVPFLNVSGTG